MKTPIQPPTDLLDLYLRLKDGARPSPTLRRAQRRVGLTKWNAHSMRHGFCSHMTRNKVSIETVRRMAGHSNLATTARYLHADADDIREAMELFTTSRPSRK